MSRTDMPQSRGVASSSPSRPLLELAPAGSGLSPKLLAAPGGFLWWYADLVAPNGDGLVVIWSFGLPFLPGYANAVRRGDAQLPSQRPSLNVSTYRRGELDFYLLQEFDPSRVQWDTDDDGDDWRFGHSRLSSRAVDGQRTLSLDLRLEVPHLARPARITLSATGPGCRPGDERHRPHWRCETGLPDHDWAPLLAAQRAWADLEIDGQPRRLRGHLYHDRNGGKTPLHELDLKSWSWGRLPRPGGDFIYYVLDGKDGSTQSLLLTIDHDGRIEPVEDAVFYRGRATKNLGGLTWWPSMTIERDGRPWLTIEHQDVVDSGPFYLRTIPHARDRFGQITRGIAEVCEPDRIDMAHHRPLVRMRVHRTNDLNSMWLPLFTGPKKGRIRRLIRSWTKGTRLS